MSEEECFDMGLKNIKEEDEDYDEETDVKEEKISDNLSEYLEDTSQTVRIARNQEELDSIDRSTRELLKLETFYNQDPLGYLNVRDSYFEDLDMGHVVTKTGLFLAVESDYLEPKTFREAWDYNDP